MGNVSHKKENSRKALDNMTTAKGATLTGEQVS